MAWQSSIRISFAVSAARERISNPTVQETQAKTKLQSLRDEVKAMHARRFHPIEVRSEAAYYKLARHGIIDDPEAMQHFFRTVKQQMGQVVLEYQRVEAAVSEQEEKFESIGKKFELISEEFEKAMEVFADVLSLSRVVYRAETGEMGL